jgi:hypothetical protein
MCAERLMTAKEFAQRAGITVRRVYALVAECPAFPRRRVHGALRFTAAALAFLKRLRARAARRERDGLTWDDVHEQEG